MDSMLLHYGLPVFAGITLWLVLLCKPGSMPRQMGIGMVIGMMIVSFQHTTFWTVVLSTVCFLVSYGVTHELGTECAVSHKRGERNL